MQPTRHRRKPQNPPLAPADVAQPTPHVAFFEDDSPDAVEHGERGATRAREDSLLGTAGTHTPAVDARAAEPFDELATAVADAEGSDG